MFLVPRPGHSRFILVACTLLEYGLGLQRGLKMVVLDYLVRGVWQGHSRICGPLVAFWDLLEDRRPHHCSESSRLLDLQIAYYWKAAVVPKKLTVLAMRSEGFA